MGQKPSLHQASRRDYAADWSSRGATETRAIQAWLRDHPARECDWWSGNGATANPLPFFLTLDRFGISPDPKEREITF